MIISSTLRPTYWIGTSRRINPTRNGPAPFGILLSKTLPSSGHQLCLNARGLVVSGARPLSSDRRPSGSDRWRHDGHPDRISLLNLHSRRVIGWAVSTRIKRGLAIRALNMAIAFRQPPRGCIHHTDRGSQYRSHDYQKLLRQHGFKIPISGKGNCYDNAAVETFFKTIEAELIWRRSWETRRQAEMALFDYINGEQVITNLFSILR